MVEFHYNEGPETIRIWIELDYDIGTIEKTLFTKYFDNKEPKWEYPRGCEEVNIHYKSTPDGDYPTDDRRFV